MTPNPFLMLGLFLAAGIGWWAFGQWLRKRGHGARLDQLGKHCGTAQGHVAGFVKALLPKPKDGKK